MPPEDSATDVPYATEPAGRASGVPVDHDVPFWLKTFTAPLPEPPVGSPTIAATPV